MKDIFVNQLDIVLLPEELKNKEISDCLVVVIDVLRASSTITTALNSGADRIIPVYNPELARARANDFPADKVLLCGERNGEKLAGFDLGNSPLEYNNSLVGRKIILLTTTNGVRTIELAKRAKNIIIGCFLNCQAVAEYCLTYPGKVVLVCSGDRGKVSLEDTVCAGKIKSLCSKQSAKNDYQSDDSLLSSIIYSKFGSNLITMMEKSVWGKHLIEMGYKEDIIFCAQQGISQIVPILKDNSIVIND
jgi:2-phosphosulfolactate phosphatase